MTQSAENDVRAWAADAALVEHMSNFVPLGFVLGKDPYADVVEAARSFLLGLADYMDETRPIPPVVSERQVGK